MKLAAIVNRRPSAAACCVEDLERHLVAVDAEASQLLGRLDDGQRRQRMVGVPGQPVGEQVAHDPGQRRDALHVAGIPAVAGRHRLVVGQEAVGEDLDVAELAGLARRPADDGAGLDHPAAEPGADDGRHAGSQRRIGSEVDVVGIQGGGVAVVVVDDRQADARLQRAPHVVAPPGRLREVGGALDADDALRAGRPGRVQPDRCDALRTRCRSRSARGPSSRPWPRWRHPAPRRPGSGSRTCDPPGTGPMRRARSRCSWWRRCRCRRRPGQRPWHRILAVGRPFAASDTMPPMAMADSDDPRRARPEPPGLGSRHPARGERRLGRRGRVRLPRRLERPDHGRLDDCLAR